MQELIFTPLSALIAGFAFLAVVGYVEFRTYAVPNVISLAFLLVAFVFAGLLVAFAPDEPGGLGPAFLGMLLGGGLLLPAYAYGFLGAGCVKAQAVFGAWMGAGFGYAQGGCVILLATIAALLFAAATWLLAYFRRQQELEVSPENASSLVHGQVPLSIGTILGVVVTFIAFG